MSDDTLIAKLNMIAAEIRHEDDLIGARISWLVISQSFLFGTFAALVGQRGGVVRGAAGAVRLLLLLIPLVGVLLPLVVLAAIAAASYAISQWRAERERITKMPEAKDLDWPRLSHRRQVTVLGQLLPYAVSIGFMLAWLAVLIQMGTE